LQRCGWVGSEPLYIDYHDREWGRPEHNANTLFEKLILEGFQSGLSWITILRKRETFRAAFAGFDPKVIAAWGEPEVETLLQDPGIIRHRGKIEATLANARAFLEIEAAEGFAEFIWGYVDGKPVQNAWRELSDVPSQTPVSAQLARDLKKRGFKFCGPTTVYAFMQAAGLVNDHLVDCPCYEEVAALSR